eukprot:7208809-Pyramimonas_sp.AAC.1
MEPQSAVLGGGTACEHRKWGLQRNSLRSHETLYWAGAKHAKKRNRGIQWSSLWGHETLYSVVETHADTASDAF